MCNCESLQNQLNELLDRQNKTEARLKFQLQNSTLQYDNLSAQLRNLTEFMDSSTPSKIQRLDFTDRATEKFEKRIKDVEEKMNSKLESIESAVSDCNVRLQDVQNQTVGKQVKHEASEFDELRTKFFAINEQVEMLKNESFRSSKHNFLVKSLHETRLKHESTGCSIKYSNILLLPILLV